MPGTILNAFHAFMFLILTTTLSKGFYYCPHFTDKQTMANKISCLSNITVNKGQSRNHMPKMPGSWGFGQERSQGST